MYSKILVSAQKILEFKLELAQIKSKILELEKSALDHALMSMLTMHPLQIQ